MLKKGLVLGFVCAAILLAIGISGCQKDTPPPVSSSPTPYELKIPKGLPAMNIPPDNQLTVEGIELGRKLFYDPILSGNLNMSCATCHNQKFAFTDSTLALSVGIDNLKGTRNSMPLFNLGYQRKFFWDGGAADLESQVIAPIENPVEMHETLPNAIAKLNGSPVYPQLFEKAFGTATITTPLLMKAIAQFERTLLSGNSNYDKWKRGEASLTAREMNGMALFENPKKGDCVHCHSLGSTFSDFEFRNTGLDSIAVDAGRYRITLVDSDSGKFKTPSLRNIAVTSPYMHDGRFTTLQQCLNHYNTNFHYAKNLDPNLLVIEKGRMNQQEMDDVIAFLNALTDTEFLTNPAFSKP